MLLDIIIAGSCGGAGICCGWVMHALHRAGGPSPGMPQNVTVPADDQSPRDLDSAAGRRNSTDNPSRVSIREKAPDSLTPEKVATVADRIRAFAAIVAANVDEHQTKVDAVNGVLHASDLSGAPPEIIDAVEQLLAANETMRSQLEDAQERLREQTKQLQSAEQRAETDALTQLSNRGAFDKRLDYEFSKGYSGAGVLAILDIDFFKRFNDEHGHRIGDEVLRSVASMLEARLQPYGLVARFGGEEFCALIDESDYEEAIDLIEKTRHAVSNREIRFEGKRLKVTMSVGIGKLQPQQSSDEWLQRVDDALYRSKEAGRNCAHYIEAERFIRVNEKVEADAGPAAPVAAALVSNPSKLPSADPNPIESAIGENDPVVSSIASDALAVSESVEEAVQPKGVDHAAEVEAVQLAKLSATLRADGDSEPPRGLAYLPDRETMIDGIAETLAVSPAGGRSNLLMAVTLSGQPGAATMRSLLQLVRAAMRSQDRIGCLNHSTLLVSLPDCQESESLHRAEQICGAAASVGLSLASADKSDLGERLSIGILGLQMNDENAEAGNPSRPSLPSPVMIDRAISQVQAVAMLGGRVTGSGLQAKLPILARTCSLENLVRELSVGSEA
ncbi:GGDEF domain-containing protein [Aporhodopirellula aestuarii]|uniref:diguanylate cyclase n=1 Tax=Aporhodopirellula aestuarii TaxID=2950107 RepID=A0ABT0U667_9BACT|nr:GGDEF domain-containing protein [Aporhodopirellula aestuarii]MCM2372159.1 GGDEF domain-containing protein [Aporhodopirellula aestuarii]